MKHALILRFTGLVVLCFAATGRPSIAPPPLPEWMDELTAESVGVWPWYDQAGYVFHVRSTLRDMYDLCSGHEDPRGRELVDDISFQRRSDWYGWLNPSGESWCLYPGRRLGTPPSSYSPSEPGTGRNWVTLVYTPPAPSGGEF